MQNQIVELTAAETEQVEGGLPLVYGLYLLADFAISFAITSELIK